jgi:hypothetical protein
MAEILKTMTVKEAAALGMTRVVCTSSDGEKRSPSGWMNSTTVVVAQ